MVSLCDLVNTVFGCIFIIGVVIGQPLIDEARFPPNYLTKSYVKANTDTQNPLEPLPISTNTKLLGLDTNASLTTIQNSVQDNPGSINKNEQLQHSNSVSVGNEIGLSPSDISKIITGIEPNSRIVSFTSFDASLDAFLTGKMNKPNVQTASDLKTLLPNSIPDLESEPYLHELPIGKLSSPITTSSNVLTSTPSTISETPPSLNTGTIQELLLPKTTVQLNNPGSTSTVVISKTSSPSQNPLIAASSFPMDNTGDVFAVETGIIDSNFMSNFQPTNIIRSGNQHISSFSQTSQTQQHRPQPMARHRTMPLIRNRPSSVFTTITGLRRRFPCMFGLCRRPVLLFPLRLPFNRYMHLYRPFPIFRLRPFL